MTILPDDTNLIWSDLEMTGLDPNKDRILEVAIVPTDRNLNLLHNGFFAEVKYPPSIVNELDEWCLDQHTRSGLIQDCLNAEFTLQEIETQCIDYCLQFVNKGKGILCGNSIFQDKAFINRWMVSFSKVFHYRVIDVSSVKELVKRWNTGDVEYKKKNHHRAKQDILESIYELRHYKEKYFKSLLSDQPVNQ